MMLTSWLHLLSLAVYLGSLVGLWVLLIPALSAIKSEKGQIAFLVRGLKIHNPLQIGALGFLVLTGAFQVTDLKAVHRESFTQEFGALLGLKLVLSFVLIILSTYQCMGVSHRFVRRCEDPEHISSEDFRSVTRRLQASTPVVLILALLTILAGVWMR